MKSKYLIFDLDGTLLDDHMMIREKTLEAIELFARKNNYLVTIATGRSLEMSIKFIKEIKADNFAIVANGTLIYDIKKNQLIPNIDPLKTDVKKFIFDYLIKHKNGIVLVTTKGDYFYALANAGWELFSNFSKNLINMSNKSFKEFWEFIASTDIYSISMFMKTVTVKQAKQDFSFLENEGLCRVTSSADEFIDITSGHITKYDGFKKICELIDIDLDNTYCFGDSENDYEMICNIKNSVAMGNACLKDKSKAKYVLKDTNNTDAIYDFLSQQFSLNK